MYFDIDDNLSYWATVARYRWPATIVAGIALLCACIYAAVASPIYRVSVTMAPNLDDESIGLGSLTGQFGGLATLAGINLSSMGGNREAAIATLRSRAFTESFISQHNLLPILFADRWDSTNKQWIEEDGEDPPSMRDAYRVFDKNVSFVEEDLRTGLVRLVIEWTDRELAARWANDFVSGVNESIRQDAISQARSNLEYLDQELEKTTVLEIRNAIFRLVEVQIQQAMMANVRESFAFKIIDPAVVPDSEEYVRPNRILVVGLALLFSPIIGVLTALAIGFASGFRTLVTVQSKEGISIA